MVTAGRFPDLRPTGIQRHWQLPVEAAVCVGPLNRQFLFGGMGLGASILVMEQACDRPVIWATAQYLSFAPLSAMLDLEVAISASGNFTSQARVVGRVGDTEILTVNAALGARPVDLTWQGHAAPDVPPPQNCPLMESHSHADSDVHAALDIRVVKGRFGVASLAPVSGDGRVLVWMRPRLRAVDAVTLAMMADFVPSASGNALNVRAGGNSLDNTIRICRIVPTQWVLCDIHLNAFHAGFGHGQAHLFAEDGTLMAVASQSFILRAALNAEAESKMELTI